MVFETQKPIRGRLKTFKGFQTMLYSETFAKFPKIP